MIIACYEKGWMNKRADEIYWQNLCKSMHETLQLVYRLEDAEIPEGHKVVILDETADISLKDFQHPDKAAYLFGRSGQMHIQNYIKHDYAVKVVMSEYKSVFAISIAPIVLYDRMLKRGDFN